MTVSLWAGARSTYDVGAFGFNFNWISVNLASIKFVVYVEDGEIKVVTDDPQFLPFDLGIDRVLKTDHGFTIDAAEFGRYQIEGHTEIQAKRDNKNNLSALVLNSAQIQGAIGYMVGQVKGGYDFMKEKGNLVANVGQDWGMGTGVGWSASAWLVIPIIE